MLDSLRSRRLLAAAALLCIALAAVPARASAQSGASAGAGATVSATRPPVPRAAPYEYLGWGDPQSPASVITATGVHDLTMAFILSKGRCNPAWDGQRPLVGGTDAAAISQVRAAGGDVDVSVGGWSGYKLGIACTSATTLTAAYQKVVDAYHLAAIDIDIENTEVTRAAVRARVIEALAALQKANPALEISITFGTNENGPDADGRSMIDQAAALGFQPYAWTIMPFDFGAPVADMGTVSIAAAGGLEADLAKAYKVPAATAWAHVGISSMNGDTDETDETVSIADFQQILTFAESRHLARLTFWAVNRDRSCTSGLSLADGDCDGITQSEYAFTDLVATYSG